MIFFTADAHFYQPISNNIFKRPFNDIEQMNETLIENWNSTVNNNDEIYILGDLMYEKATGHNANYILEKLHGKKYLIKGNNDKFINDNEFNKKNLEWIRDYYVMEYDGLFIYLFHFPILVWENKLEGSIHLYGHMHNYYNLFPEKKDELRILGRRAINVGVDVNNYFPISISDVLKKI
jgi:calcineurin-like phosphoesterase family protein